MRRFHPFDGVTEGPATGLHGEQHRQLHAERPPFPVRRERWLSRRRLHPSEARQPAQVMDAIHDRRVSPGSWRTSSLTRSRVPKRLWGANRRAARPSAGPSEPPGPATPGELVVPRASALRAATPPVVRHHHPDLTQRLSALQLPDRRDQGGIGGSANTRSWRVHAQGTSTGSTQGGARGPGTRSGTRLLLTTSMIDRNRQRPAASSSEVPLLGPPNSFIGMADSEANCSVNGQNSWPPTGRSTGFPEALVAALHRLSSGRVPTTETDCRTSSRHRSRTARNAAPPRRGGGRARSASGRRELWSRGTARPHRRRRRELPRAA